MAPQHLEQVLVDDPELAEGLTAFGEFLRTSYFYPSGSYERCEDSRAPNAWATISKKFDPFIKVSHIWITQHPVLPIIPNVKVYQNPLSD
ncbi:hypothetical protein GJ744_007014 [Endocarpon pusillum]|uniref:Uncharacterized protein n=1 Tax=Endocarpon pusillum TaxID=364733 RepID=A0A8H7E6D4_9EURO|nr:hypothetical protein GJ744_007014 [Endocarpon pusillum]